MKDRQKKMLRLLLSQKELCHLDELAKAFSVGRRTVSRDLDSIEHWLAFKNARLERKPGKGISVSTYGGTAGELLDVLNSSSSYIEALDPAVRKKLIFLYLLYNNREIKISEMAAAFLISDTSVWNDLNLIEEALSRPTLTLHRHKGVGIQLSGEESEIRLEFLTVLTELISVKTIIPYLYSLKTDSVHSLELNQLRYFLRKLNFPANRGTILRALSQTAKELGYQYTMSGEAVLYFYLQMSMHRIKSGCLIEKASPSLRVFKTLAEKLLSGLLEQIFSGLLPQGEITFLGLFLGVLETGSPPELRPPPEGLAGDKKIGVFTEQLIHSFGTLDNHMYYLNGKVEAVLRLTLANLVTRLQYGIPLWHGEWGDSPEKTERKEKKRLLLAELLKEHFSIAPSREDLDYLILYFQSLFFKDQEILGQKIRCLVCCFEGIGLASYLQSVLQRELDVLDVVESTAVFKIRQDYLEAKNIELVLSTFPIAGLSTPVINIFLPLNKSQLIEDIMGALSFLGRRNDSYFTRPKENNPPLNASFERIIRFIGDFSFLTLEASLQIDEIIDSLSRELTDSVAKAEILAKDFRSREALGILLFEEYGTRVLHCKSSALEDPLAGILKFNGKPRERMLFMAAPDPCSEEYRKMLSTITRSFMDNTRFRHALTKGDLSDIRRSLMDVYKEMV